MKILVVEDEHKIARNIKQGLEQEAHIVNLAYDGLEGYDMASEEEYDIIILDLMLPEMDGITVCRKLRQDKNHTPILMLTARDQVEDKVKGLDAGADDYLPKPFTFSELLARLRALSRRPRNLKDNILTYQDISLDTVTYNVTRAGKDIKLSRKEFALLEYFLRNKGKIINKDQIINNVWDYDSDILPNTVEVYIGYLRNKLGKPNPIQTARGFGYKLEVK